MPRAARTTLAVFVAVAAVWFGAQRWVEVQLPARGAQVAFPDPMRSDLSLERAFATLPAAGGGVADIRLLQDNTRAWVARWRLLADARERIDVCYFILKPDVFGAAFLGHLLERAADGVQVRVLLDGMGSVMSRDSGGTDYLDGLAGHRRLEVRMYRPLRYRLRDAFITLDPRAYFASGHDKILSTDGRRVIIGGRNISHEYFASPDDDPRAFRDTDLYLEGHAVGAAAGKAFGEQFRGREAHPVLPGSVNLQSASEALRLAYRAMDAWLRGRPLTADVEAAIRARNLPWLEQLRAYPGLRGALRSPAPAPLRREVRLLDSHARLGAVDDPITRSLIRLVRSARRSVFIQSPYVVLPPAAVDVLAEAGARGIAITLLTNGPLSSDNAWSQAFFQEQWPGLLARVPRMRLLVAGDRHNLHGKFAVVDDRLVLVGTYNLDPLSMALNSELIAAVWSPTLAERLLAGPRKRIAAGSPAVLAYGRGEVDRGGDAIDPRGAAQCRAISRYRELLRWVRYLPAQLPVYWGAGGDAPPPGTGLVKQARGASPPENSPRPPVEGCGRPGRRH